MEIVEGTPKRKWGGDWLGVICSLGCAIHCAAMPILLSVLPSLTAVKWMADPLFHQVVAVTCAVIVLMAILPAWKQHRSRVVAGLATAGIALLFVAAFVLPDQCCSQGPAEPKADSKAMAMQELSNSERPSTHLASFSIKAGSATSPGDTCDDDCVFCRRSHEHEATYSRPLFTAEQLEGRLGPALAEQLIGWQPFLSPLGGVLLILGHLVNIRYRACACPRGSC